MEVSFYATTREKTDLRFDLNDILSNIKNGTYQDIVFETRKIKDKQKRSDFKGLNVPAFMVSGTFEGSKSSANLQNHSGFLALDFDGIEDVSEAKSILFADKHSYAGFTSVSGTGLCIIVKIDPKKHLDAFRGAEEYYYNNYGYVIDPACSNVNRLRFVSYDPELYINFNSSRFNKYPKKTKRKKAPENIIFSDSDIDFVCQQIQAKGIDLTEDYNNWVEIGMALKSHLGDAGLQYYKAISQFHPEYNPTQIERKYESFKGGSITIATFFYYAKLAGLQLVSEQTKQIAKSAMYSKKGRVKQDDAAKKIEVLYGLKKEKSQPIIDQVYDSNATIPRNVEDDLVTEIEEYIKKEYNIKYNEITLNYEDNGIEMNDRAHNSVYVNTKRVIEKASRDLVGSIINSEITPKYNPVKDWFKQNYNLNTKGNIDAIADSIETVTGLGKSNDFTYVRYFLRKWMIGAVAMWHGELSPLMLVLAGERQNTGKTVFFRKLLPEGLIQYFAEAELNGDKDENLLMCSTIMIMNDEMSNKSKRDITVMKKLCSVKDFNIRPPYGRTSERFKRIAALCGTSNNLELLSDPTGNRRIIPIEVYSIKHSQYNDVDKTNLWMEAYHAYKAGESYELTNDDIKRLNESTHEFQETSIEAEMIIKYFEPCKEDDNYAEKITASDIKSQIEIVSHQRLNIKKLGSELKSLGFTQKLQSVNGRVGRYYVCKKI